MHMTVCQILLANLSSVALLISIWMHLSYRLYRLSKLQLKIGFGLTIGLCLIASMMQSVPIAPGVFFDLRVSLLCIAGVFGGPVALAISTSLAIATRVAIGGAGMVPGLYGLFIVASVVLVLSVFLSRHFKKLPGLFGLAALSSLISLAVLTLLPSDLLATAIGQIAGPVAVVNFVTTSIAGLVMMYFSRFTQERDILRAALTQAPDFHYVKDLQSKFVVTNLNVARHNGRRKSSEMAGLSDFDINPERAQSLFEAEQAVMASGAALTDVEECLEQADGSKRWFTTSKVPLRNRHGDTVGLSGVTRDITERKRLEEELTTSRNLLSQAMAEMSDGLAMFDRDGRLVFCNEQYAAYFPRSAYARKAGAHITDIVRAVVRNGERKNVPLDASEAWIEAAAATLFNDKDEEIPLFNDRWLSVRTRLGQDGSCLAVVSDITAIKQSEQSLQKLAEQMRGLAETDSLTGIANRRTFDAAIEREFNRAKQNGTPLTLLMVDVDRFKAFNDLYGHQAGDQCLKQIGQCLNTIARRPADLVARYGGEEFALLLPDTGLEAAEELAEKFKLTLERLAMTHDGSEFGFVTASVGLATLNPNGRTSSPSELIEQADGSLYQAKKHGRNRVESAVAV